MKFYNVHRVSNDNLEAVINGHVAKGYELHNCRGIGNASNSIGFSLVIFVRVFENRTQWEVYREAQLAKRTRREPEPFIPDPLKDAPPLRPPLKGGPQQSRGAK